MIDLLRILVAPVAWLAAFSAVYGLHGLICEIGPAGRVAGISWTRLLMTGGFAAAVLLQVCIVMMLHAPRFRAEPGLIRTVSLTSGWVGLVATIWTLFPVLVTTACG